MVDIFIHRAELLPADETVEQHYKNIEEERMAVEIDKTTDQGLFKGAFNPANRVRRQWVEEDQLFVCSGCHHEHIEGDRRCGNCQILFEDYESDSELYGEDMDSLDGDGPEIYSMDIDGLTDEEDQDDRALFRHHEFFGAVMDGVHTADPRYQDLNDSDMEDDDEDNDEDTGSLRAFIASDTPDPWAEESVNVGRSNRAISEHSHISLSSAVQDSEDEEDSDDEAIVTTRRRNRNGGRLQQIILDSDSESSGNSDSNDIGPSQPRRSAVVNQSENEDIQSESNYDYDGYIRHAPSESFDDATETSENNTIQDLEPEEGRRTRDSSASTPRRSRLNSCSASPYGYGMNQSDNETDQFDGDGDVEMSVSPDGSCSGDSPGSDSSSRRTSGFSPIDLGPVTVMEEEEEEEEADFDSPPLLPVRRRRQAYNRLSVQSGSDEEVTLTQLFTRPSTGVRRSPTFDSQRILEWHASTRGSPENSSTQSRRIMAMPPSRPSRGYSRGRRIDMTASGRNFTR